MFFNLQEVTKGYKYPTLFLFMFEINSLSHEQKLALLYGIMAGDGCLSFVKGRNKCISITGSLNDDLPFFDKVVSPLLKYFRGKETNIKYRKSYGAIEFNFNDMALFDLLSSYGFPIGKKGQKLFIPRVFYEK